jgi:hypothetical protein
VQHAWQDPTGSRKESPVAQAATTHYTRRKDHIVENTTATTAATATPQAAASLYTSGKPVVEVANDLGITYGKARKLIAQSGTDLRDPSSRLKGRTRPVK